MQPLRTLGQDLSFGPTIRIASSHIRHATASCAILADLSPILPGHLVVTPTGRSTRLADKSPEYRAQFWCEVRRAMALAQEADSSITAFNVRRACVF